VSAVVRLVQGSAEWHEHRRHCRNASETPTVLGVSPWQTPYQLWQVKLGLTEVRLGIIPGAGGTQRLARVASVAAAKELILTGRRVRAQRAYALGIVSDVVPADNLADAAAKLADEIAAAGPLALAAAKGAIDGGAALPLDEGLALEAAYYQEVLASDDRNEGLAAFAEKRPPVFKGK